MGKNKKEKKVKEKKPSTGKLRGFIGVMIAILLLVGVGVCDALTTGKNLFSFVSTGSFMDRFDAATAETSRKETEEFFDQAAVAYSSNADQKYTSYTFSCSSSVETSNSEGVTYVNKWKEISAMVDVDYTVLTMTERYAEGLSYTRVVTEYVLCKSGENAGRLWGRRAYADVSVGDVDLLEKATWTEVSGGLYNEMDFVNGLLVNAQYTTYDIVENKFNFTIEQGEKTGRGFIQAGLTPTVSFSYEIKGEAIERATHTWKCSNLNATKAIVPQSLVSVIGGNV